MRFAEEVGEGSPSTALHLVGATRWRGDAEGRGYACRRPSCVAAGRRAPSVDQVRRFHAPECVDTLALHEPAHCRETAFRNLPPHSAHAGGARARMVAHYPYDHPKAGSIVIESRDICNPPPKASGTYNPYENIRSHIHAARVQFSPFKAYPGVLVLFTEMPSSSVDLSSPNSGVGSDVRRRWVQASL